MIIESKNPDIAEVKGSSIVGLTPGNTTIVFTKGEIVKEVQVQVKVIPQYIPFDGLWEVQLDYVENHVHIDNPVTLAEGYTGGGEDESKETIFYVGIRGDFIPRADGTMRLQGFNSYLMKKYVQTPGAQRTYMKKFLETSYDSRIYQPIYYYDNEGYMAAPTYPDDVVDIYCDNYGTLTRMIDYDQFGYIIQYYTLRQVVAIDGNSPDFMIYLEEAYRSVAGNEK